MMPDKGQPVPHGPPGPLKIPPTIIQDRMNDPLSTIREVAARLVNEAQASSQNDLAIRQRECAATLRCAAASIARHLESLAAGSSPSPAT